MSSSGIGPEPDSTERCNRIEEIERIRREEEKGRFRPPFPPPGSSEPGFLFSFLLLMEKLLDFLKQSACGKGAAAPELRMRETLLLIRAALETMMREDRSEDAPFLRQLSHLWQKALEQSLRIQTASPFGKRWKSFVKTIGNYPEGAEHPLGYYLEERAGLKWLPFPYMELIQALHRSHEIDPASSSLSAWAKEVGEMLTLLNEE